MSDREFIGQLPPEIQAEYEEADQFLRDHGVISMAERRAEIKENLSPEVCQRYETVVEECSDLENALNDFPAVEHLKGIYNLGGKADPDHMSGPDGVILPAFHSRYDHVALNAELAKVAAAQIRLSPPDAKSLVAGAWLHDVGHPAFCHIGDEVLKERGELSHEQRADDIVRNSHEVRGILWSQDVDPSLVQKIVAESGRFGQLQKVLDTLSYLIVDAKMLRKQYCSDYGAELISDLRGLDPRSGALQVGESYWWQEFLENRAEMMRDIYYHPDNRRLEEAKKQLLRLALKNRLLSTAELIDGRDQQILLKLQSLVQNDPGASRLSGRADSSTPLANTKDLLALALGFFDYHRWHHQQFFSQAEAERSLAGQPINNIEQSFIVPPFDYRQKQLLIQTPDGEQQIIKSNNVVLRPEDSLFTVYRPKV